MKKSIRSTLKILIMLATITGLYYAFNYELMLGIAISVGLFFFYIDYNED